MASDSRRGLMSGLWLAGVWRALLLAVSLAGWLAGSLALGGCATPNYPKLALNPEPGKVNDAVIQFGGISRPIKYYVPNNFEPQAKHPVIMVIHGFNQPITPIVNAYRTMQAKADRDGTLLVYPIATGAFEKQTLAWNTRYGSLANTKFPETAQVDDVAYLGHLFDVFLGSFNGDPDRLYVTGTSLGGAMTYSLSGYLADRLAAVAPVIMMIGPKLAQEFARAKPLPVMIVTGTADPLVKYDGIPGDPQKDWLPVLSNDDNVAYWKARNGLAGDPVVSDLPNPVTEVFRGVDTPSHIVKHAWASPAGNDLVWMKVVNGGHWLPTYAGGKPVDPAKLPGFDGSFMGNYNSDWDASGDIYDFLLRHRRKR